MNLPLDFATLCALMDSPFFQETEHHAIRACVWHSVHNIAAQGVSYW